MRHASPHRRASAFGLLLAVVAPLVALGMSPGGLFAQAIDGSWPDGAWPDGAVRDRFEQRFTSDLAAISTFRPGYRFWEHVFTLPDGSVAYGSAEDGRLLAVFPSSGSWEREGLWNDPALGGALTGRRLEGNLTRRREEVAGLLVPLVGPLMHNPTRGTVFLRSVPRYGAFLEEWGSIYERFGVPAEVGLAQAVVESGLDPKIRSEAGALGFCQWLPANWDRLKRLASNVIEGHNQTTQAQYCAAYLSVLATKYGSFLPALSEHHAGGTNVGRTLINGSRLGGTEVREQYLRGSQFAKDLRAISMDHYRDLVLTYGPRSFSYTEMVLGTVVSVARVRESIPQQRIFAIRAQRPIPIEEVTRRTGLTVDEVRRFNPALLRQVPTGANLYLPFPVEELGPDVTFWHNPPSSSYASALADFLRLGATPEEWDDPSFETIVRDFQDRFRETETEEGRVMAAVLAYVWDESSRSRRREILDEFRMSEQVLRLFQEGLAERETAAVATGR